MPQPYFYTKVEPPSEQSRFFKSLCIGFSNLNYCVYEMNAVAHDIHAVLTFRVEACLLKSEVGIGHIECCIQFVLESYQKL